MSENQPANTQKKKSKKTTSASTPAVIPVSISAPMDVDFPRGATAAPIKQVPIENATYDHSLFNVSRIDFICHLIDKESIDVHNDAEQQKPSKRKSSLFDGSDAKKQKVSIPHTLKYKNLVTGMTVLGAIKEIHDLELVVCLPNNLIGTVAITEVSDEISQKVETIANGEVEDEELSIPDLHSFFKVGDMVRCIIIELKTEGTDAKKKINLSLKPRLLYADYHAKSITPKTSIQASVKSIEDRGYLLNCGVSGVNMFLNSKNIDGFKEYKVGQLIQCSVMNVTGNGRIVNVSTEEKLLCKTVVPDSDAVTIDTMKAGTLVNVNITETCASGLWVKFIGSFEGSVSWFHSIDGSLQKSGETNSENADIRGLFAVGQKVCSLFYDMFFLTF